MEHKYNKGSEWRKWDLHIHTPYSIHQNYGGATQFDKFIDALERLPKDVKVIGITDYYFIDGYEKVMEYREKGRLSNIDKIFPILEFRIDTFGSGNENKLQKINLHILFDVDEDKLKEEIKKIREEFILQIPISSLDKHKTKMLSIDNFTSEGDNSLQQGFSDLVPPTAKVVELLNCETWKNKIFTFLGYKEWSNLEKNNQLKPLKEDLYNTVNAFLSATKREAFSNCQKWLDEYGNKKLLYSGDIHDFSFLDTANAKETGGIIQSTNYYCDTWIKADPTFEGLKQIIYEPSDRVIIQEADPTLDFEKSPFTEISISEKTQVFIDDDDLFFEATTIPLNNNLISIIGGRGTGKSMLINYLAAGLNKRIDKNLYNISDKVTVKRKTSLLENEKDFVLSTNPNIPFMYIAQSQIKELVTDKSKFTKNIRETIGVIDDYKIPETYLLEAENLINEYYRIIKIVNSNNEDITEKKKRIDLEIKRYEDFIANVTSEQNKTKLNNYTKHIASINTINEWVEKINLMKSSINDFTDKTNIELTSINQRFEDNGIVIPLISTKDTVDYLDTTVLVKFNQAKDIKQIEVDKTKEEFKNYSGDLSSLLSSISSYQTKLSDLKSEKETIEKEEKLLLEFKEAKFKELGAKIEYSINEYATKISDKWTAFKVGNPDLDATKKEMLLSILGKDALDVSVKINFDTNRLYSLLMDKLDGRSFNVDKLKSDLLKINSIDSFFAFIKQDGRGGIFENQITSNLNSALIDLFYKKFNSFIKHEIIVTLNSKPITKLSHGQQGTIYLRLQIAANLFSETIIYDQPEDDLDNSFITDELVGIFKEIKKYRQVIIVSHNANLVVNSDSEQVIVAKNEDGVLKYDFGSLEDPVINSSVCKILEGGKSAFEKREQKYGFK